MNLLSSILPGIRDIRTPFAVGVLWAFFVALVLLTQPQLIDNNRAVALVDEVVGQIPSPYAWAAAAIGIYLLGCVALPIQSYYGHHLSRRARLTSRTFVKRTGGNLRGPLRILSRVHWRLMGTFSQDPWIARNLLQTAVTSSFARGGAPEEVHYAFPADSLLDRLDVASMQLGQSAPDLAQEYDRLRTEAEFRSGVVPPLAVLLIFLSWYALDSWLAFVVVLPFALLAPLILSGQAHRLRRQRQVLAARCVNLGYVRIPVLDDLSKELERAEVPAGASVGAWAGVTASALKRLGEGTLANNMIYGYFNNLPVEWSDDRGMRVAIERGDASLLATFDQAAAAGREPSPAPLYNDQPTPQSPRALLVFAWTLVGVPLAYGLYQTVKTASSLFGG